MSQEVEKEPLDPNKTQQGEIDRQVQEAEAAKQKANLAAQEAEQKENDVRRDKALSDLGLRIVRFKNDEVLKNLSMVVGKIKEQLN